MEELIGTNVLAVPMIDMLKKEGDGISSVFDQMTGLQLFQKTWTFEYLLYRKVDPRKCEPGTSFFNFIKQHPQFVNTGNINKPNRLKIQQQVFGRGCLLIQATE